MSAETGLQMYDFFRKPQVEIEKKSVYSRVMRRVLGIAALGAVLLGLTACNKQPAEETQDMHPFTEEELQKKQLDDAFTPFVEALELDQVEDIRKEIRANSKVRVRLDGGIVYQYNKNGKTLIDALYKRGQFTADLYGGIRLQGQLGITGIEDLSDAVTLDVYYGEERIAKLGFEVYEYSESGEDHVQLVPVFRFDDGTSYAVTGLLLIEPLLDYLLENVLSTE